MLDDVREDVVEGVVDALGVERLPEPAGSVHRSSATSAFRSSSSFVTVFKLSQPRAKIDPRPLPSASGRVTAYLRSLNPELPRSVWLLQAGGLANFFGNGMVVPFLIIYLHNVRGLSLAAAGLIAASNALAALVSGPLAGALSDRVGPRQTLVGSLSLMAVAISLFPLIHETWQAFALNALLGFGSGGFWPSQSALVTGLTPPDRRHAAFAQQRVTMNLGFGLGGLTGGLIATTGSPESFTKLFLLDAVTFLVFAVILSRIPSPARPAHGHCARAPIATCCATARS